MRYITDVNLKMLQHAMRASFRPARFAVNSEVAGRSLIWRYPANSAEQ
jgi:hypothetical protein